jgi:hypothetical protein
VEVQRAIYMPGKTALYPGLGEILGKIQGEWGNGDAK